MAKIADAAARSSSFYTPTRCRCATRSRRSRRRSIAPATSPATDPSKTASLGAHLGPLLWQFAPTKKFDAAADFGGFLELLPDKLDGRPLRHVIEVRHDSFRDGAFIALLRQFAMAVVYTDHAKYPNIADLTGGVVYARLQRGKDAVATAYPPKELDAWAGRLQSWAAGAMPDDLPPVAEALSLLGLDDDPGVVVEDGMVLVEDARVLRDRQGQFARDEKALPYSEYGAPRRRRRAGPRGSRRG